MRKLLLSSAIVLATLATPSYAQQVSLSVANEGATGTTIGKLAKFTATNPVTAIIATTGDTDGVVGIVSGFSLQGSTGITGNAYISQVGITNCTFDTGGVTAKHYVIASTIAGGSCADGGATRPTGVQVIGIAQATGGSGASVAVQLDRGFANAAGSGSPANPTATAGPTAVNGAAGTFMRSDAAPAVQKGSNAQFGIVEGDGSTITCVAGVCSSISGGAGTVTNNGNLTTHAPIVGGTNGTTDVKALAPLTNGQVAIGSTGADPVPATPAGGGGTVVATGAGSLTITTTGAGVQGGQSPSNIGDNTTALPAGHYYYATNANMTAQRTHALPDSATQGVGDLEIFDAQRTATATNQLCVQAAGTDKLAGTTNGTACITAGGGSIYLHNDGAGTYSAGAGANIPQPTDAQLIVGKTGSPSPSLSAVTMSQDCTITNAGVITCTKTNNVSFGALSTTTPGSGVSTAAAASLSAPGGLTTTIASGTSALGTGAISSATCATVVTTAATNTATTDVVSASFNGDPTAVTGYIPATAGMLTIISYPTSGNVNFKVCNNTNSSITPGAITLNWRVVR